MMEAAPKLDRSNQSAVKGIDFQEKLKEVMDAPTEKDEISRLYILIREDPSFLPVYDDKQQQLLFADTPLHMAASLGRTALALELLRLMPSYGRKLDPDGFTPVNTALKYRNRDPLTPPEQRDKTAIAMVRMDRGLSGVSGREGMTPLHYAAQLGDEIAVAELLLLSPKSINTLTNRQETAVHLAVKFKRFKAFSVMFGWVKRTGQREVLKLRDCDGNTLLHLAAMNGQPKVINFLLGETIFGDGRNSQNMTPKDLAKHLPETERGDTLKALKKWHCFDFNNGEQIERKTFSTYLRSELTVNEKMNQIVAYISGRVSNDLRSAILVVAVLIATATFQASLNPPGSFTDKKAADPKTTSSSSNSTATIPPGGIVNMEVMDYTNFIWLNSVALATSLGTMLLILPAHWANLLLYVSLAFMAMSYTTAVRSTSPPDDTPGQDNELIIQMATYAPYMVIAVVITVKLIVLENRIMWAFRRRMGIYKSCDVEQEKVLEFHGRFLSVGWKQV